MEIISEEFVEECWQQVSMFSASKVTKDMQKVAKSQPHLLAFIVEFTQDLDLDVKELAVYMYYNVYRMFQKSFKKKIKKVSDHDIINCYEQNEKLIESLEGAHDKFLDRIARVQISEQPFVMKYVLDTLFEEPDEDDPVELADEDSGYLFLLFKTVIDILNEKTEVI